MEVVILFALLIVVAVLVYKLRKIELEKKSEAVYLREYFKIVKSGDFDNKKDSLKGWEERAYRKAYPTVADRKFRGYTEHGDNVISIN